MNWYNHMEGWGMFGMIFFWIFLVLGIVLLVILIRGQDWSGQQKREDSPSDILKKRYAKGEINEKQYHQMRKELEA